MFTNADNMRMTLCKCIQLKDPKQTAPQTPGHLTLGGAVPSPSKEEVFSWCRLLHVTFSYVHPPPELVSDFGQS